VVMLARPYHHDPGLNHGIPEEFQKLGYPVFSQNTLPLDEDLLERLFGDEVRSGIISDPLDIPDVWKTASAAQSGSEKTPAIRIDNAVHDLLMHSAAEPPPPPECKGATLPEPVFPQYPELLNDMGLQAD
jgi:hypothetical protein